ncbi:AlpA family phage regulatory protein [Vibrio parahaemolyticus]|nr:AlpA family phage regulatory protein [Vibrio parahaemolyticus]EHZ2740732.1 AlpA family phage regulatory protein [Vibrio parahaemolyticus]EJL6720079.1 AlpA family phage regulatory protein [Vibrio alginolyticus]
MSTKRVIRMDEVKNLTGLSRATINRYRANGDFPKNLQLGANSIGFFENEVIEWLESRRMQ